MGQGEPINAVISGFSDERVLKDQEVDGGLRNYFLCASSFFCTFSRLLTLLTNRSLGFSGNCLGQLSETEQAANLGDGNGASA